MNIKTEPNFCSYYNYPGKVYGWLEFKYLASIFFSFFQRIYFDQLIIIGKSAKFLVVIITKCPKKRSVTSWHETLCKHISRKFVK